MPKKGSLPNWKTKTIKQMVFLPATPEEVYDALIDPKKHTEFTGATATCDDRVGGVFTAWDKYITGKNLTLDRGVKIVQEWKTSEWPEEYGPSILQLTLRRRRRRRIEGEEDGTELTMVHSKVPAEQAEMYREGWVESYWEPLKAYFGRGGRRESGKEMKKRDTTTSER